MYYLQLQEHSHGAVVATSPSRKRWIYVVCIGNIFCLFKGGFPDRDQLSSVLIERSSIADYISHFKSCKKPDKHQSECVDEQPIQ